MRQPECRYRSNTAGIIIAFIAGVVVGALSILLLIELVFFGLL